jgi:hypothetical protein
MDKIWLTEIGPPVFTHRFFSFSITNRVMNRPCYALETSRPIDMDTPYFNFSIPVADRSNDADGNSSLHLRCDGLGHWMKKLPSKHELSAKLTSGKGM